MGDGKYKNNTEILKPQTVNGHTNKSCGVHSSYIAKPGNNHSFESDTMVMCLKLFEWEFIIYKKKKDY